jgi:hypothetical protein
VPASPSPELTTPRNSHSGRTSRAIMAVALSGA